MSNSDFDNAKIFKAFCDENRLKILALLRGGEKMCLRFNRTSRHEAVRTFLSHESTC
jgi:DNA-binding transcriptional ArsR family regulator